MCVRSSPTPPPLIILAPCWQMGTAVPVPPTLDSAMVSSTSSHRQQLRSTMNVNTSVPLKSLATCSFPLPISRAQASPPQRELASRTSTLRQRIRPTSARPAHGNILISTHAPRALNRIYEITLAPSRPQPSTRRMYPKTKRKLKPPKETPIYLRTYGMKSKILFVSHRTPPRVPLSAASETPSPPLS